MPVNLSPKWPAVLAQLNSFDACPRHPEKRETPAWMPIRYRSLVGFYLVNYSLLLLMMAVPILVTWAIIDIL